MTLSTRGCAAAMESEMQKRTAGREIFIGISFELPGE
jgi:hypothetical protein